MRNSKNPPRGAPGPHARTNQWCEQAWPAAKCVILLIAAASSDPDNQLQCNMVQINFSWVQPNKKTIPLTAAAFSDPYWPYMLLCRKFYSFKSKFQCTMEQVTQYNRL